MDHFKKYVDQISLRIFLTFILVSSSAVVAWWLLYTKFEVDVVLAVGGLAVAILVISLVATLLVAHAVNRPLAMLARVIAYKLQPTYSDSEPNFHRLSVGRELITALAQQVYDLANLGSAASTAIASAPTNDFQHVFEFTPQPLIAIGPDDKVKNINRAAREYLQLTVDPTGKLLVDVANLSFSSEETFELWLKQSRENKVVDTRSWRRVRAELPDNKGPRQFDLSASFSKGAEAGIETVLVLFDQTELYGRDDSEIGLVAMAVHELRTPLTILRGYLEVFQDELGPGLDAEMQGFMRKVNASAQQLTAFVSNILNVARIEENQLTLSLREEQWEPILKAGLADLELRASVHGKQLHLQIAPNLPTVAVDRVSIQEVVNNIVENAIKYSGDSKDIEIVSQMNKEGLVETSITDHGIGIPPVILAHLFEKFYRSHRSAGSVGGTGLGLYLSRAIMDAHSGRLTVNSKEGQGSTFSFSLQPFANLGDEAKTAGQDGIMRGAHGWIKNHNVYRR